MSNKETDIAKKESLQQLNYKGLFRKDRLPSCNIGLSDLRKLYIQLNEKSEEAINKYLDSTSIQPGQDEKQFEDLKNQARQLGSLTIIVIGNRGEQIVEASVDVLVPDNLPDKIVSISFDSSIALQTYNITMLNRFKVNFDFKDPPSFNSYNPWDQPTPNDSWIEVVGPDTTWVTGVHESVLSFLKERKRRRGWLHKQITFNIANWILGMPAIFWLLYRFNSYFHNSIEYWNSVLKGSLYIYLFLLGLIGIRWVIAGFRWVFPMIELEGSRSKKVRGIIGLSLSSLILALIYDVLKALFS